MSTRGFVGIRKNSGLITGRYNHCDSYYDALGEEICSSYFMGDFEKDNQNILEFSKIEEEDSSFINDGLYCEFAYVYNLENDTLEIYRGFFKTKQTFDIKEKILNTLNNENNGYFSHLITIIDRKNHTEEQVLKAFKNYNDKDTDSYPEREIIPLELPEGYVLIV